MTGTRIRRAREEAGLTQRELAEQLGFTHTWLSNVENGSNSLDAHDLQALADRVNYPPAFFTRPDFQPRDMLRPGSRLEWEALYPDNPALGRLHCDIDALVLRPQVEDAPPVQRVDGGLELTT